jgi:UDP-GlcNAc:undecaprenyl-phosphate/decaprenyl-phosphate GlcNAc-1-phosphate transferase
MWVTLPIAFVMALGLTPLVIGVLRQRGFIDVPNVRSSHEIPTPRGGGVAVAVAALSALVVGWLITGVSSRALVVAGLGFGLIGLADDIRSRPPFLRLFFQFAVSTAAVLLLLRWTDVHVFAYVVLAITAIVGLVAFVNAFNFMDGINGISVAQAAVAGLAWAIMGTVEGAGQLVVGGGALAGAALGFAPFNVIRARVFLGDVGAYFLGAYMGVLALIGLASGIAPEACLAPTLIYFLDTGTTLVWRIRHGEQWHQPHRHHVYQRLTDAGWSHLRTALFAAGIIGLSAVLGMLAANRALIARLIADAGLVLAAFAYLDWPDAPRPAETSEARNKTPAETAGEAAEPEPRPRRRRSNR